MGARLCAMLAAVGVVATAHLPLGAAGNTAANAAGNAADNTATYAAAQAQPATGTIQGRVILSGPAPANPLIRMGADPLCARLVRESGKRPVQEIVKRAADGGLANAFVDLQGTFPAAKPPAGPPQGPVVITQRGCVYSPRVVGAMVGQTLRIVNSDTLLHNLHGISSKGNAFNTTQPQSGMVFNFPLKAEETMMRLTCDVHSWMSAAIGVETHPYFAVSDDSGSFTIRNVPAGRHTIRVWHERYGRLTKTVTVTAGGSATATFTYTGNEKPAAGLREVRLPDGVMAARFFTPPVD